MMGSKETTPVEDRVAAVTASGRKVTWGDVYRACRIEQTGLSFERFLEKPWEHLRRLGQEGAVESMAAGYLPLLPRQAKIARMVAVLDALPRRVMH